MEYLGIVMPRIEKNVCDVLANSQPGISRLLRLSDRCDQMKIPLHTKTWARGGAAKR